MKSLLRPLAPLVLLLAAANTYAANDSDLDGADEPAGPAYREIVLADQPVVWWSFDGEQGALSDESGELTGTVSGEVHRGRPGPRSQDHDAFSDENAAAEFSGNGFIRVRDPGPESVLDFDHGETVTLEAWVRPREMRGENVYVVGKGRTNNKGFARENQNYALRLRNMGGTARVSFLFRSADDREKKGEFHRWTSDVGFVPDGYWHHVAVSYTFGNPESLKGWLDGRSVSGNWDMGGATERPPVVDDDELWIGSALGGGRGNSFDGWIDEVAVYRAALPEERIALRTPTVRLAALPEVDPPTDAVLVEIIEGIPDKASWAFTPPAPIEAYTEPAFAFTEVPRKYSTRAVQIDRPSPFMLRASSRIELAAGEHELLLRARSGARLYVDGKLVVQTPFHNIPNNGHGRPQDWSKVREPNVRALQMGEREEVATIESDGGPHTFVLELYVGGKKRRPELGETSVSMRVKGQETRDQSQAESEPFRLLSPTRDVPLTDDGWLAYAKERRDALVQLNAENRRKAGEEEAEYWEWRHELARKHVEQSQAPPVPDVAAEPPVHNEIDRFIAARLIAAGEAPAALCNDWAFLRRVTLDVIGTIPTPEQIEQFFAEGKADRRARYVDLLLEHPGWADHWVGYWQDVLAENPNIVNPTLNNTGPFRWWIHESLLDSKPMDRFVTELVMMEGSTYYGGPAGFALATQNDVPMAAKAHILGEAFLGVQMQCARCHDAPFHDIEQRDLFGLAAMLRRDKQEVPKTSSIPLDEEALESLIVNVTLKPGEAVPPEWPFETLAAPSEIPDGVLRNESDPRERLAALITLPHNERFARVIANRLWKRYLGYGLVEPVHDWEGKEPSHPDLLDWLAREFIRSGYDLKHVARLILNSHTYQRGASGAEPVGSEPYLFSSPVRRRMTAEQVVDSLFLAAGKDLNAGHMSLDVDSARNYDQSLDLGIPERAWQFTSPSNERDRPSLSLPFGQPFITVLETFGWRASRQNPVSEREDDPNVLQPAILANGTISGRITRLSDDSAFTRLAVSDVSLEELIERVFLRLLTRRPTDSERALFAELLGPGYEERVLDLPDYEPKPPLRPVTGISWSNHLSPEANEIKVKLEHRVQAGDPPTGRLETDWRERMEDMLWTLINTPEFVFVP